MFEKAKHDSVLKGVPLANWLSASYLRTAVIPLCLIELGFLASYWVTGNFTYQRNVETVNRVSEKYLGDIATREAMTIQATLGSVEGLTRVFAMETGRALATPHVPPLAEQHRYRLAPNGVFHTVSGTAQDSASFYSGVVPVGPAQIDKVWRTVPLDPVMQHIKHASPLVRQLYVNTWDSFNRIFPYFDVQGQYAPRMNIPSYNFYYEADARHNPQRKVVWTDAYVDPAGGGWMVSAIAPVYGPQRLEAVVGMDVTVGTIVDRILALDLPWQGYAMLIGRDGTILALPRAGERDLGVRELKDHAYAEAIRSDTFKPGHFNLASRDALEPIARAIAARRSQIVRVRLGGREMLAANARVAGPGWSLVVLAPAANILADATSLRDLLRDVGLAMLAILLVFYVGFFLFLIWRARAMSRRVAEPLRAIETVMERIGTGEYDQAAPRFGVAEIDTVAERLVEMGGKLGEAHRQLLGQEAEVRRALDNERHVTTGQRRFINVLSHEFRTPLTVIDSCGQILRRRAGRLTEETTIERSEMIRRSAARIDDVMKSALQLVQLEEGEIACQPAPVPLGLLLRELARPAQADPRGIAVVVGNLPNGAAVLVDRILARSALAAIVDNARKYSHDGGTVTIEAQLDDAACRITIRDQGVGIAPEDLPHVRDRFFRGANSTAIPGAGTGLYLAATLVEANAGQLAIASTPGQGTTVTVMLPLAAESAGDMPEAA